MQTVFPVIIAQAILIALVEWIMWHLFRKRRLGMEFPREVDESMFRFITNKRAAFFMLGHAVFLIVANGLALFFIW